MQKKRAISVWKSPALKVFRSKTPMNVELLQREKRDRVSERRTDFIAKNTICIILQFKFWNKRFPMDRTMEMNNDFNLMKIVDETIVDAFNFPKTHLV